MFNINFGIFCVATMMVHLAATQNISTLPDNIGSCQPIKANEVKIMIINFPKITLTGWNYVRHKILCQTLGIIQGTISQYSVLVEVNCIGISCIKSSFLVQLDFYCHSSNNSYSLYPVSGTVGSNILFTNPYANFSTPFRVCGECSRTYFRNEQHCGGIL